MKQHIPNALTLSRYVAIALLIAAWYVPGSPAAWVAFAIVVLACISDFFDGYLARKWNVQSEIGRLLDPNADKLIVATALVLLLASGHAHPIAVIIILCRELFISGLREFMAERAVVVRVTKLAKWKTTLQMVSIIVMLCERAMGVSYGGAWLLWAASALTLITGAQYLIGAWPHVRGNSPQDG